jgi:glycosyltransferase involved in cell wall biosynthesis
MRLTIVQYAGDYRQTWERFERGGKATYQAQRYSVAFVGSLAARLEQVAMICAITSEKYDINLTNGVRAIGVGLRPRFHPRELLPAISGTRPDRLLLTTPMLPLLKWARKNGIRTLAAFADSFQAGGPIATLRQRLLARELNQENVEWVANHGVGACLSLLRIGVDSEKIIPWDWPPSHSPAEHEVREPPTSGEIKLVYVGAVVEAKGVGDLLRAMGRLQGGVIQATLNVIGADSDGRMQQLACDMGLEGVSFSGLMANEDIPAAMRAADAVVIPSRHEYPEGLPLTIYEALAARTPIIASDHPMFRGALVHDESALIFPASDDAALADEIRRLATQPELYAKLSIKSMRAWEALQLPVSWGALIDRWLSGTAPESAWLHSHRLLSGIYRKQIAARS